MKHVSVTYLPAMLALLLGLGRYGYFLFETLTRDPETLVAPVITTSQDTVHICPNGKVLDLAYSVTDNRDSDIADRVITFRDEDKYYIRVKDTDGNTAQTVLSAIVADTEAPVLTLASESSYSIYAGDPLDIPTPTAVDNCDDVTVDTSGSFDYSTPGTYDLTFSSADTSGNSSEQKISIEVKERPKSYGVIYLTFDDGPGDYTSHLLDILAKYNVKATFFVTCSGSDSIIKRAYDDGHTIALHTCSHNYSYIYSSVDNYFSDLESIQTRVKNITGVAPTLIRFPGGSSNTVSANYDGGIGIMSILAAEVTRRGYTYFDWNISSGDAGGATTSSAVYNNVTSRFYSGGSFVVLQHDIKNFSVDAVERIIKFGQANGYTFAPLTASSPTAHHRISN